MMSAAADFSLSTGRAGTGTRTGDYRLLRLLGRGGMANVWLAAWLARGGRPVALKRIAPDLCRQPSVLRMFLHEARLAMRLDHPNIARALDAGELDGQPFIAFELIEGIDLRTLWRARRATLPIGFAVYVARQLCAALDYAHRLTDAQGHPLGLVHRDVTPSNVMLGWDGAVKLVDFGVAKALNELRAEATRFGVVKGKIGYLAPEQIDGAEYDHRVDLFALGVILHELLGRTRLFTGADEDEVLACNRACYVPPPSARNPEVGRMLDEIALRALARDPRARYAGAAELGEALARAQARWPWTRGQSVALLQPHRGPAAAAVHATVALSTETEAQTRPYDEDDWLTSGLAALMEDGTAPTATRQLPPSVTWRPTARIAWAWASAVVRAIAERRRPALVGATVALFAFGLLLAALAPLGRGVDGERLLPAAMRGAPAAERAPAADDRAAAALLRFPIERAERPAPLDAARPSERADGAAKRRHTPPRRTAASAPERSRPRPRPARRPADPAHARRPAAAVALDAANLLNPFSLPRSDR